MLTGCRCTTQQHYPKSHRKLPPSLCAPTHPSAPYAAQQTLFQRFLKLRHHPIKPVFWRAWGIYNRALCLLINGASIADPCNTGSSELKPTVSATLALLLTCTAANGQTGSMASYTAMIVELCQQYASEVVGFPANAAFNQCMLQRHCWRAPNSSGYQCEEPGPMTWHGGGY
jgi:hypothetical protein